MNQTLRTSLKPLSTMFIISLGLILSFISVFASEPLKIVENEKVCMVTDMHFGKTQIPVPHDGKTYYGCCENCKKTLSTEAKARIAKDPVSGKSVDKAKAVIAARSDNSVLYFESKKTFDEYTKAKAGTEPMTEANRDGHSHH